MLEVDDHFWEICHGELPMIVTIFIYNSIITHDGSIGKMGHIYPAIYYKKSTTFMHRQWANIRTIPYNRPMDAMGKPSIIMVAWCHSSPDWVGPKKLCKKPERRRGILNIYIAGGGHGGRILVGSFCKLVACHVGIFEAGNCDLTSHFTISFPHN